MICSYRISQFRLNLHGPTLTSSPKAQPGQAVSAPLMVGAVIN
jgi:hypothetical protein